MAKMSRKERAAVASSLLQSDPALSALWQQWKDPKTKPKGLGGRIELTGKIMQGLRDLGVDTHDLEVGSSGMKEKGFLSRNAKEIGIGLVTAPIAASFLAPGAMASGAAPATTATGIAPATGGATAAGSGGFMATAGKALPWISGAARVGGAISKQRAENRAAEQEANDAQQLAELRRSQTQNQQIQLDLQQRQFLADEEQRHRRNAVMSDYLRGVQDVNISAPSQVPRSQITGGMRPSAIPNRDEIGRVAYQQAMENLLDPMGAGGIGQADGSAAGAGTGSRRLPTIPFVPELRETPRPNAVDKGLDWLNIAGAGLGFIANERANSRQPSSSTLPPLDNTPISNWRPRLRPGAVSFSSVR